MISLLPEQPIYRYRHVKLPAFRRSGTFRFSSQIHPQKFHTVVFSRQDGLLATSPQVFTVHLNQVAKVAAEPILQRRGPTRGERNTGLTRCEI